MNELSEDMITEFAAQVRDTPENKILKEAMMKNGINGATLNNQSIVAMQDVFSEQIETGDVTDQKKSGRCWIFAALNTFRHRICHRLNLDDFELSEAYMMFWDKLEKGNYFLESILKTLDEPLDGRLLSWLLETPQQDGGQWDMLVSLVQKYGVVPKSVMPETYQSGQSKELNSVLNAKLRSCAIELRQMHANGHAQKDLEAAKVEQLSAIYTILAFSLGEPPKTFHFEYRDNDDMFHRDSNLTPHRFFEKYVGMNLADYVSIINAPTDDKPYKETYTVKLLGNVVGGKPIKYLNVDMETLKDLAMKQIKDGETVWFGCDVSRYSDRKKGILDTDLFDYETAFGTHFRFTKAQRLDYQESMLTHAMVLTGVNLVNDKPNRWRVENSWGKNVGDQGYYVMSDDWMDEFTYEIVVHKQYLSDDLWAAYQQEPHKLDPWDPMGSLAWDK